MASSQQVRTAIVGLDPHRTRYLERLLQRTLALVCHRPDPRDALTQILATRPNAVLLHLDGNRALSMQLARRIKADLPEVSLILLTDKDEDGLAREAMRLGARAYFVFGADDADLAALYRRMGEEVSSPESSLVLGICGSKGGVGTSLVAMNMAGVMSRLFPVQGLLLDLAPCLGELGVLLDLDTPWGLMDIVQGAHRVDEELLERNLCRHPSGFYLLGQQTHVVPETPIDGEMVLRGLRILRGYYGWVLADIGGMLDERSLTAASLADHLLMVTTPDLPALVSARRRLDLLAQQGRAPESISILVNRVGGGAEHQLQRAAEVLGRDPMAWLIDDGALVTAAQESALLFEAINPEARLTQQLEAMTARLCGASPAQSRSAAQAPSKRRLFGFI